MRILITALSLFAYVTLSSQEMENKYMFPINPGQQNYLAGTVGEIRSTHFHTGIDVKTGGRTGLPIYAIDDGYVYRAKMSSGGYGNTLYLKHPDGRYSVYAHLKSFEARITQWVTKEQYKEEAFEVNLFPEKDQLSYKKGDIIAYSGNTGSSSGPHLHFEIRNKENKPIDVLSLGFNEIRDRIPPVVKKIAFVPLASDARINGYFGRQEFTLSKIEGVYTTSVPVNLSGKIGIEIYSYDPMDGIPNKNGIVRTELWIDEKLKFEEQKETISFSKQRSTLVHYNYSASKKGSRRFNKLYLADGNEQEFYKVINKGIDFNQTQKLIEVKTFDSYDNSSITSINLSTEPYETKLWFPEIERFDNFLHLRSNQPISIKLNEWQSLKPYKTSGDDAYYVWDLRKGTPSSIFLNGQTKHTHFVGVIPSNQKMSYIQKEFELTTTRRSLFDTLYLSFEKKYDSIRNLELFDFNNQIDPFRSNFELTLKPNKEYHIDAGVYSVFRKKFNFMGGEWDGNDITFNTRDLAQFTILRDSIPPIITPRLINSENISFRIKDDLSGIKSFRAELNGEFILMYYEPKRNLIWSKKLKENIPFEGEFNLEVIDNANNTKIYKKTI